MRIKEVKTLLPLSWLFLFAGIIGCAVNDPGVSPVRGKPEGFVNLKRPLDSDFLVLQTTINESRNDLSLLIDTGSEVSGILMDSARNMIVDPGGSIQMDGLYGGSMNGIIMHARLRPAGGTGANSMPIWATHSVEHDIVLFPQKTPFHYGVEGLLGADYLKRLPAVFDVGNRRLGRATPGLTAALSDHGRGWARLDLLRSSGAHSRLRFVACHFHGRRLIWLVDTGGAETLLSVPAAVSLNLPGSSRKGELVDVGGRRATIVHSSLRGSFWGDGGFGREIRKFGVGITLMPSLENLRVSDGAKVDGLLGIDSLRKYRAVIDYANEVLWLRLPSGG